MKIYLLASLVAALSSWVATPLAAETLNLPGLSAPAQLHTDALGVPHIVAATLHDSNRVLGWVHARDRLFQMDLLRRTSDGRRAELTGDLFDVFQDAAVRQMGLRAAAEREGELLSDEERAGNQAYADGVNAWLGMHPLPVEYDELEVSSVPPWTALDALLIAKASEFPFDVIQCDGVPCDVADTELLVAYEAAGDAQGFDGHALFVEDHFRMAPMDPAASVPDAGGTSPSVACTAPAPLASSGGAAKRRVSGPAPAVRLRQTPTERGRGASGVGGSNVFAVGADRAESASPMLAVDGHGSQSAPSYFYEIEMRFTSDPKYGALGIAGATIAGVPAIFGEGQNDHIAWGATDFLPDVADVFADRLVRGDPGCPSRLCIESDGALHPVVERRERYFQNEVGDGTPDNRTEVGFGPALARHVLTVPFRGHGPVIAIDDATILDPGTSPAETTIQTLQYTGLHGSYTARGVLGMVTATDVAEFGAAVRDLATLTKNYVVTDSSGALAYFTSGEVPLRADLEAGALVGREPRFVRDGSGPNNWISDPARSQGQVLPYRVIPPEEMPQVVDPPAGFVVNANNDPSGAAQDNDLLNQCRPSSPSSIHYLGPPQVLGLRAARITRLLAAELGGAGSASLAEMQEIQANTQQLDAELLVPFLVGALTNAQLSGAPPQLADLAGDAAIVDAVSRLGIWDFSTPTGIPEGYDSADVDGVLDPTVSPQEAAASVAATLYNVWRAEVVEAVVVARLGELGLAQVYGGASVSHLHHLLTRTPFTGVGASGVDFFPEPAALSAGERRDVALLAAVRATLDRLASDAFEDAFGNSTDPDDYRWGLLNRLTLPHPLGGDRSVPPAAGFVDLTPDLPGIARGGAWHTVNISRQFGALARAPSGFEADVLSWSRRVLSPGHPDAFPDPVLGLTSLPGGASGDYLSPFYMNQLPEWLTVDQHPVLVNENDVAALPSEPAVAAAVSKGQQSCVTELNKRGAGVGKAQGKETSSCLKQAAKGKETDPQTCLSADAKGKVAKAQEKALKGEQKKCGERPFFGYSGAQAASDAGEGGSLALTEDLFGADLNAVVIGKSSDKSGATCQAQLQKSAQKALETVWKEAGKAAKGALAGKQGAEPAESGTELQDALAAVFGPSDKVEKALGKIESGGAKKCGGVSDLAAAAPGACADADVAEVTGCLRERALCRACRSVNAMEALALPCDSLDDGDVNDSC